MTAPSSRTAQAASGQTQVHQGVRPDVVIAIVGEGSRKAFLREEDVSWREDPSNADGRFLRAAFRTRLKPLLDEQFPRWRQQLLGYAQGRAASPGDAGDEIAARDWMAEWFGTGGVRLRRVHWKRLQSWLSGMAEEPRKKAFARSRSLDSMDLAGGWTVHWEAPAGRRRTRIVIERD